jgi:RNA-directed DNA polymerase
VNWVLDADIWGLTLYWHAKPKVTSRLRCAPRNLGYGVALRLRKLMQRIRRQSISEQADQINIALRGHYAYYVVAGNLRSPMKVYRVVELYRRKMCAAAAVRAVASLGTPSTNQGTDTVAETKTASPYGKLQMLAVL